MTRRRRLLIWAAALLVATPILLLAVLLVAANTDVGRRQVERLTVLLSGGQVIVSGLSGHFPGDLRAARLELRDARGPWLTATDIALRSSPSQLLRGRLQVALLSAGYVGIVRAPVASATADGQTNRQPYLRRLDVDRLRVARFEVGAALAGADAALDLQGSVHAGAADEARATFLARRLDGPGVYEFVGHMDRAGVVARLDVREPAGGPLANLVGLPGLGKIALQLRIDGSRAAESTHLTLTAGPLTAAADGTIDLTTGFADLDLSVAAPSMTLRPDLSWDSLSLTGRYHGAPTAPEIATQLRINGARVGGVLFRSLDAQMRGRAGTATVVATLAGLRVRGPRPDVLEASPIELRIDANLADPARPMTFSVVHPLMSLRGRATAGERPTAAFKATFPSVEPFAKLLGADLRGQGAISGELASADGEVQAAMTGTMTVAGGSAPWARLFGPVATLDLSVARRGTTLTIKRARMDAGAVRASIAGTDRDGMLDLRWTVALPALSALAPMLAGSSLVQGEIRGTRDDFGGRATARVDMSIHGSAPGAVDVTVRAQGFPRRPSATLDIRGRIDAAPIRIAAALERQADGASRVVIRRADWRSATGSGDVMLPAGSSGARGKLSLRVADLQDLQRVVGAPLQGRVAGTVKFSRESGRGRAEIRLEAMAAGTPDRQVGHLLVSGRIDDAPSDPMFNLQAVAEDIVTPQVSGSARLDARGPARGVVLKLESRWHAGTLDTAHVSSTATLDVPRRRLAVSGLKATYRGQTARLLAPTTVSLQDGLSLGVVRIGIQKATLTISGAVTPTLDAAVSLTNAPLALLAIFRPAWQADGLITADARLTGMVSAPTGILHVSGSGLRVRSGAGRGMPLTDVVGTAALHGDIAAVDLRLHAGAAGELRIVGSLPLRPDQAFDVRASGQVALAIANPYVEPDGRRVSGRVTINAVLTGTRAAPLLGGTLVLDHGDFQDFVRGTHFSEVSLALQAAQRTVRITRMLAHAGPGTVSAEGTIGLLVPGIPLDLRLTAINARVLASDLLTARVDATLTVRGEANGRMEAVGSLRVNRADITVPKAFPRTVAVLDVRRPGARRGAPKPRVAIPIGLDLVVDAPRAVFVRGRGIEAELGGELHVSGTTDAPRFAGGFDLRRGTLALAGASLKFTSGRVGFNGAGVGTALDPTLHFVADTTSTDMTATLTVGGYASAPTVLLTSTPELAQDEILARLLFGESAKQLTPLQLLRVGLALASIGGSGYGAADPLSAIQKRLGLDHLAVGGNSGPNGNEATLEAGGYTSERVYVGAVQSTSGTTKLLVQVDLTKHLKLQAVVGNGGAAVPGTTPQNDPGNTIGLSYQIDY